MRQARSTPKATKKALAARSEREMLLAGALLAALAIVVGLLARGPPPAWRTSARPQTTEWLSPEALPSIDSWPKFFACSGVSGQALFATLRQSGFEKDPTWPPKAAVRVDLEPVRRDPPTPAELKVEEEALRLANQPGACSAAVEVTQSPGRS